MKRVLVVDDSETVRNQVGRALTQAGFEVTGASDGLDGLEKSKDGLFSLVLLDVNMPRMSGLDLLEKLREQESTKEVPALVLTTEVQESLVDRAKRAGAAGWIVKPVKMELLVAAAHKVAR